MRFIVPGPIAAALPPSLVPCFRGLGLVRFGSLGLIALGCAGAMNWIRYLLPTDNCELTSPLSCRWRSDWLPCHPSQSIGGIRDRRFQFLPLPTDQRPSVRLAAGNLCNGAAATVVVHSLDASLSPPVQRGVIASRTAKTDYRACRQRSDLSHLCFVCF
jgi:hypothetical protein